nr:putative late blight resistance protein homolog R1C-3 isoform X1 [Ipomoea trifida]
MVPNLKELGIYIEGQMAPSYLGSLVRLHLLEKLKFEVGRVERFYLPTGFPPNLKKLTLRYTYLPWKEMDTISELPHLEVLKLKDFAFFGSKWEPSKQGFRELKALLISRSNLKYWDASSNHFPLLERMVELPNNESFEEEILVNSEEENMESVKSSEEESVKSSKEESVKSFEEESVESFEEIVESSEEESVKISKEESVKIYKEESVKSSEEECVGSLMVELPNNESFDEEIVVNVEDENVESVKSSKEESVGSSKQECIGSSMVELSNNESSEEQSVESSKEESVGRYKELSVGSSDQARLKAWKSVRKYLKKKVSKSLNAFKDLKKKEKTNEKDFLLQFPSEFFKCSSEIFDIKQIVPQEYMSLEKQILAGCYGLPLAIVSMAGLLAAVKGTIGSLHELQFLKLKNLLTFIVTSWMEKFPLHLRCDILGLPQLRDLHVDKRCSQYLPCLVKENLQTFYWLKIASSDDEKQNFRMVPNLKELGIYIEGQPEPSYLESLVYLHRLEKLKVEVGRVERFCLSTGFPPNLKKLTLRHTYLPLKEMDTIGRLRHLEVLKVKDFAFYGSKWEPSKQGFRKLKALLISRSNLKYWNASANHFPVLERLVLRYCWELKQIPINFANMGTLKLIVLECCYSSLVTSANQISSANKLLFEGTTDFPLRVRKVRTKVEMPNNESSEDESVGNSNELSVRKYLKEKVSNSLNAFKELKRKVLMPFGANETCIHEGLKRNTTNCLSASFHKLLSFPNLQNEADSWTNLATEGEDVEDNAGQTNGMQDPLQVTGGPITRERAKRLQGALNGLMHKLNNNKTELWELGEKSEAKYVNVIAVQD